MRCPKCYGAMEASEARRLPLNRCLRCEGIWIDTRLIAHLVIHSTSRQPISEAIGQIVSRDGSTSAMQCPRCDEQLSVHVYKELEVDWCTVCRGIFLDRGELEKIQKLRRVYPRGEKTSGGETDDDATRAEKLTQYILLKIVGEILGIIVG